MKVKLTKSTGSYRHGNLREAILIASLQIVEKNGVENLSIREAAKLAGVTHQAPYRHFKNREVLLAALAQDGFEKLYAQMQPVIERETDARKKLIKIGECYFLWATEHPDHFRLMFHPSIPEYGSSESLLSVTSKMLELLLSVVAENQRAEILNQEMEPRSIARQFWAAIHGVSLLFIDNQFKPFEGNIKSGKKLVTEIISSLIDGLHS